MSIYDKLHCINADHVSIKRKVVLLRKHAFSDRESRIFYCLGGLGANIQYSDGTIRLVDLMNAAHERTCAPASIVPSGPVPSSGVHETRISHPALVEPAIEPKAVFWVTVTVPDTESGSMPSK